MPCNFARNLNHLRNKCPQDLKSLLKKIESIANSFSSTINHHHFMETWTMSQKIELTSFFLRYKCVGLSKWMRRYIHVYLGIYLQRSMVARTLRRFPPWKKIRAGADFVLPLTFTFTTSAALPKYNGNSEEDNCGFSSYETVIFLLLWHTSEIGSTISRISSIYDEGTIGDKSFRPWLALEFLRYSSYWFHVNVDLSKCLFSYRMEAICWPFLDTLKSNQLH